MRRILLLVFFITSIITDLEAQISMSKDEISTFKQQVKLKASKTKTIISDFTQYKHLDFLSNDIKTLGKMTFKAPALVKWHYTDPYNYSIIFKANKLLINDDGKKSDIKIGSSKLFKKLNELIVNSVNGDMFDDNEFTTSYSKSANTYVVVFNTKSEDLSKYIRQFVLSFDRNNFSVSEVKMVEPSNDYTRILFTNRKENLTINDEVFTN